MSEESQVDFDYFADVDFELSFAEICDVLERIDGLEEEYEASGTTGSRTYRIDISEESGSEDEEEFDHLEFTPVAEATPPADGDVLVARFEVEYDLGEETDEYAPTDTFWLRFSHDGYEIFTNEFYLRTAPTELFELLKPELEAGP